MLHAKHVTALIFRIKMRTRNERNGRSSSFPKSVARMQRADGSTCCAFSDVRVQESFGRYRRETLIFPCDGG
jgi:hypothetical protein